MKEASGELSMTAITVVAIAAIGGVFTAIVWPQIKVNILNQTKCANKFTCNCSEDSCSCKYYDASGTPQDVTCPVEKDTSSNSNKGSNTNNG